MSEVNNNWSEVVALEEIPQLGSRVIKTDTMNIAVFRTASDEVFAMKDECPHKQGPLSQGIVHGTSVTCPLDRKSTRLNSSHPVISYAVFCLKKKENYNTNLLDQHTFDIK